ncbi:MAG: TolC family protein [Muribaculaceae bacterium]|nr:TolC family protein [Muribaculaceae bacterium]
MNIKYILTALILLAAFSKGEAMTIEQCVEKAMANYPIIKKYNLMTAISEIELSDINKGWLPRIGLYGQITGQNSVPSFPDALSGILQNMGQEIKGMGKIQYKVGIDLSQTIWDGGTSKARRDMARTQEKLQNAGLDVELYQVRQRVENLYFAILLTEEQTAQSRITYNLLCDNLKKLKSMLVNGVAMQADIDMVEAQALTVNQNIITSQTAAESYRKALEIFIGESLLNESLEMPEDKMPADTESHRPELKLFERKLEYNESANRLAQTSLKPNIGLFAQGYYGYPGFNYFQSMMNRKLSFNILAGVKVAWNIDSFYTKKNTTGKTRLNAADIAADRDVFLFNTRIQSASQTESIKGIREMMKDDSRIVALRSNVRKAAEAQLNNGVIDITALLTKISDENMAILISKYHEILLLQEIYKLKFTLDQ